MYVSRCVSGELEVKDDDVNSSRLRRHGDNVQSTSHKLVFPEDQSKIKDARMAIHQTFKDPFDIIQPKHHVNGNSTAAKDNINTRRLRRRVLKRGTTSAKDTTPVSLDLLTKKNYASIAGAGHKCSDGSNQQNGRKRLCAAQEKATEWTIAGTQSSHAVSSPTAQVVLFPALEILLKMVFVYYTGCCKTGLWYTCTGGRFRTRRPVYDAATVLDRFVGSWKAGLEFAKEGNIVNVHQALAQARGRLPRIVEAEHPSTIRAILEMLLEYTKSGLHKLTVPILKDLASKNSSNHPLAVICRQILRIEAGAVENMALSTLACAVDTLAGQCGEYHYSVIRCQTALIKSESPYLDSAQVGQLATRFLTKFETSGQFSVEGYLNICESLLENMDELGSSAEAEIMIQKMSQYAVQLCPERNRKWTVRYVDLLSNVQFCQGKMDLAEQNCRWCIRELTTDFGASDPRVQACMSRLSKWLRIWKRFDEALEVEEWRVRASLPRSTRNTSCMAANSSNQSPRMNPFQASNLFSPRGGGFGNNYGNISIGGTGNKVINGDMNVNFYLPDQVVWGNHGPGINGNPFEVYKLLEEVAV